MRTMTRDRINVNRGWYPETAQAYFYGNGEPDYDNYYETKPKPIPATWNFTSGYLQV